MRIEWNPAKYSIPASQTLINAKQASNSGKQQITAGVESKVTLLESFGLAETCLLSIIAMQLII